MKRALVLVALTAATLSGTVACSDRTTGRAVPDETQTTSTGSEETTDTPTEPTSAPGGDDTLASLDPCELFTSSARSALGVLGAPQPDETPSAKTCQWSLGTGTAAERFTYGVGIFPKLGVDKVNSTGPKKEITVGSRRAIESLGGGGAVCAISIEVTATSRVDVQATGRDGASLCPKVLEAAKLVEPELP